MRKYIVFIAIFLTTSIIALGQITPCRNVQVTKMCVKEVVLGGVPSVNDTLLMLCTDPTFACDSVAFIVEVTSDSLRNGRLNMDSIGVEIKTTQRTPGGTYQFNLTLAAWSSWTTLVTKPAATRAFAFGNGWHPAITFLQGNLGMRIWNTYTTSQKATITVWRVCYCSCCQ